MAIYQLGDKVKYHDGRIGTIIGIEQIFVKTRCSDLQAIIVRFPDKSIVDSMADHFKAVVEKAIVEKAAVEH
jgi:hypothetical protein